MRDDKKKIMRKLTQKEEKFLNKQNKPNTVKVKISEKVPPKLYEALNSAFNKAFEVIFLKGTSIIEKTISKDKVSAEYDILNYAADKIPLKKNINKLDNISRKTNFVNNTFTTLSGVGMGLLGMGLPDIPVFTAALLKGIYETALSYGFDYNNEKEKIYILRIIRTALSANEDKFINNQILNSMDVNELKKEISLTSNTLANAMLIEKFVQGIPLVGAAGGFFNNIIYNKVLKFAKIKYKQRYLKKQEE